METTRMGQIERQTGYAIGWRTWDLETLDAFNLPQPASQVMGRTKIRVPREGELYIGSIVHHVIWKPGVRFDSDMNVNLRTFGRANTGVHAWNAAWRIALSYDACGKNPKAISGRVALWGHVHYCPNGFLGEKAYPLCFFIHPTMTNEQKERIQKTARFYGVDVEPWPTEKAPVGATCE